MTKISSPDVSNVFFPFPLFLRFSVYRFSPSRYECGHVFVPFRSSGWTGPALKRFKSTLLTWGMKKRGGARGTKRRRRVSARLVPSLLPGVTRNEKTVKHLVYLRRKAWYMVIQLPRPFLAPNDAPFKIHPRNNLREIFLSSIPELGLFINGGKLNWCYSRTRHHSIHANSKELFSATLREILFGGELNRTKKKQKNWVNMLENRRIRSSGNSFN